MSDGGRLAETLADLILDGLNERLKNSGKDNLLTEYLFGKNDFDFNDLIEKIRIMAMQVNLDQIKIGTLLEFANISIDTKYPEDRQFFKLIIQYLKRIEAQRNGGGETPDTETSELNENSDTGVTDEGGNISGNARGKNTVQKTVNRIETKQNRLISSVDSLKKDNRNIRTEIEDSEARAHKRSIRMERSIKRTIKSRMGKLWSLFKKTLVIGLLLFFSPVLKKAFDKLADLLTPVTDWFKETFPTLYGYIKDLSAYVGSIASDFKFLTDEFKAILDWKDENSTLISGIEGAMAGVGLGAALGSIVPGIGTAVGALLGGLIGFGVGAGSDELRKLAGNKETDEEWLARNNAEAEKNQTAGRQALDDIYTQEIKRVIPDATDDEVKRIRDIYYNNTKIDLEHDNWFDKLNAGQRRLAEGSGKYSMNAGSWAEYAKAHPNASVLPTWDEWIQYIDSKGSSSSETAADALESPLNGQTTVESDETGNNSVSYQVLQQTTVNNYNITESDTLWAKT